MRQNTLLVNLVILIAAIKPAEAARTRVVPVGTGAEAVQGGSRWQITKRVVKSGEAKRTKAAREPKAATPDPVAKATADPVAPVAEPILEPQERAAPAAPAAPAARSTPEPMSEFDPESMPGHAAHAPYARSPYPVGAAPPTSSRWRQGVKRVLVGALIASALVLSAPYATKLYSRMQGTPQSGKSVHEVLKSRPGERPARGSTGVVVGPGGSLQFTRGR